MDAGQDGGGRTEDDDEEDAAQQLAGGFASMDGAAYIAQLNAVCQFLRQEGFVGAEKQLLQELEHKFPSIGRVGQPQGEQEDEEDLGRQA